ncbi:MaoC family dehydratase N-terminal domain-containing protein [Alicyclobacillus cycloheptanicus]|uniref:Acyl dehydratase n=1 Tax=Alicyclobacillus cycloheptanicus TaxID=1457 RepID=A0ABT9XGZ5_9BACL|nr:MaoC/PaaZ C-terminal domain-containing protein [Alicyclobacillus cycloheptanicus]MDQ0189580.1 acyl dehydratase [Alicyclobacillus cycloheptanicus]WDM01633.1 MaoC family dehydratase N-terminal domain-containing protein [Alicyclobacillus cycloheptanicus]
MYAKYFDEYEAGESWSSHGRTITEAHIVNFAGLSGDWFPLHTDAEYAERTVFQQRIAHGMLVLSVATGLMVLHPDVVIAFYGMDNVRFVKPTFIGDTIHLEMTVADLLDKHNGTGVVASSLKVVKQTNEPVVVAGVKMLLKKRGESTSIV